MTLFRRPVDIPIGPGACLGLLLVVLERLGASTLLLTEDFAILVSGAGHPTMSADVDISATGGDLIIAGTAPESDQPIICFFYRFRFQKP